MPLFSLQRVYIWEALRHAIYTLEMKDIGERVYVTRPYASAMTAKARSDSASCCVMR